MKRIFFKILIWCINRNLRYEEGRTWFKKQSDGWGGYWVTEIYIYKNGTDPKMDGFVDVITKDTPKWKRWRIIKTFLKSQKDPRYKLK